MQLNTSRFGDITVDENSVIRFPDGIPGFEHTRSFVLVPHKTAGGQTSPFRWLQCIDEPNLALPVVNPWSVRSDYSPTISGAILKQIGIDDIREEAQFLSVVTIPANLPSGITVNLLAPILINRTARVGKQVIVQNENYSIRTPLVPVSAADATVKQTKRIATQSVVAAAA